MVEKAQVKIFIILVKIAESWSWNQTMMKLAEIFNNVATEELIEGFEAVFHALSRDAL
jgi:hypothetical protein